MLHHARLESGVAAALEPAQHPAVTEVEDLRGAALGEELHQRFSNVPSRSSWS
jgi:hypothetical protein